MPQDLLQKFIGIFFTLENNFAFKHMDTKYLKDICMASSDEHFTCN